jgi:hypothetical protein
MRKPDASVENHDDSPSNFDDRTDSGYVSQARVSDYNLVGSGLLVPTMSDAGNLATNSDLSSFSNGRLSNFISEFAEELAAGLPQSIPISQLPILSNALPNLLEAFAGKFGYENSSQLHFYLMRLVYKYRL